MTDHGHDHNDVPELELDIAQGEVHHIDIDGDGDTEPIADRDPLELAQAYVDEVAPGSGWKVDEISGNVDFGMVTVLLGQYLPSGDVVNREATAEGHGTTIPAAVDAALGQSME